MTKTQVKKILRKLYGLGYKQAGIERALELPFGTLNKAYEGKYPKDKAAFFAVLKMIGVFPWLIEVADQNFAEKTAVGIAAHAAIDMALTNKFE